MPLDGSLVNVSLTDNLESSFPLQCEIKKVLEKAAHKKIVMYRAIYRPEVGNHRLFCQRAYDLEDCNKKTVPHKYLYPPMTHLPRQCSSRMVPVLIGDKEKSPLFSSMDSGQNSAFGRVNKENFEAEYSLPIDHYKYVWGLQQYLDKRLVYYDFFLKYYGFYFVIFFPI
jgi:hypothetical protein